MKRYHDLARFSSGLLLALVCLAGCAHGSDGARQAEYNTNAVIGAGYRATRVYIRAQAEAIDKYAEENPVKAQMDLNALGALANKALQALSVAADGADSIDAAIGVAEAAKQKDYSGIISKLVQIGADVIQALGTIGIKVQP